MKKKVKKIPKFKDGGLTWKDMSKDQRWNTGIEAVGAIGNTIGTAMSGQDVTLGGALSSAGSLAATGFKIGGPIGAGVGAAAGLIAGTAGRKNNVNENSTSTSVADIAEEGSGWMKWFGMSEEEMMAKANRIANANISEQMTEQIRSKYAMNPNNPNGGTILAAEGGVMRKPVDALVSKGELIYNPETKKLTKVPGSKGKPNKKDDVYARLSEGDVVISNSPTMIMANGKTPAQNLEGLVDSDKNVKAKEAIIKKVVNWQEAHKSKTPDAPKYEGGTPYVQLGKDPFSELEKNLFKPIKAEITGDDPLKNLTNDQRIALRKAINDLNGKKKGNWLSTLSDYAPLASALLHKPSYHKEQAYINPIKYVPTGVSIDPIRRVTDEGMAIARYNQMNVNPSTGAGMAAGLQAAINRSKSISDAYKWQQDAQNKLIAHNTGIYNDWATREAQARHTANIETQQNEAAARLMRDQAIKDAYEFQTGRRNDRWKLSMLEPMFKYAVDDNIWKKFAV